MHVQLFSVPYDSGHENVRMGRGPAHFLEFGLEERLREDGHEIEANTIRSTAAFRTEVAAAYELNRILAPLVHRAVDDARLPLVLSGNCNSALGMLSGMGAEDVGVIWFDAHGDFHTPETTRSGFFDGMALAAATGRCWRLLSGTIPGFVPVPEEHVVLVGARDMESEEADAVRDSGLCHMTVKELRRDGVEAVTGAALDALATRVRRAYVHIDLDVLDPSEATANGYAVQGGLTRDEMAAVLGVVRERLQLAGVTVAAYDPSCDTSWAAVAAGTRFMRQLLAP